MNRLRPPRVTAQRQRGVVLMFCLIILVVLLAGGVAVMRSMNASLSGAGNLAFKRDLINQGELATSQALRAFQAGGLLNATTAPEANVVAANYSAVQLQANAQGVPLVLLSTVPSGPDITGATFTPAGPIAGSGNVTVHYVIDRLCAAPGPFAALVTAGRCAFMPPTLNAAGGSSQLAKNALPPPAPAVYRVSVRVDGPRGTQAFVQGSFSRPE